MIHGKLPNDAIWWLSKDGLKIWIESKDLELKKFTDKTYNIRYDRLYKERVGEVGELTSSRLQSRKWKKAWVIKLGPMIDVYPELAEEINRQTIEEKKRKKTVTRSTRKGIKQNNFIDNKPKIEVVEHKEEVADHKIEVTECKTEIANTECKQDTVENSEEVVENKVVKEFKKEQKRDFFDINRPYVKLLKDEINKNGKLTITYKNLKEKMGEEFLTMPDMRIQYGLKKVMSSIGIDVYPGVLQKESALVMEKIYTSETAKEEI